MGLNKQFSKTTVHNPRIIKKTRLKNSESSGKNTRQNNVKQHSMGKKGFLITLIAVLISILFFMIFSANLINPPDARNSLIEGRVILLNSFIDDAFSYTEKSAKISGYSAFQGVINDSDTRDAYYPNFESDLLYCIRTGNLTPSKTCPGMENKSLTNFLDRIVLLASNDLKISAKYSINRVNITQNDPFSADIIVNLTLNATDDFATIRTTRVIVANVKFDGLEDPIYLINGTYRQQIKKTNITKAINWNSKDLQDLWAKREYRSTRMGISFFNRIKGNFTNSSLGIESFINQSRVSFNENDTMVDHYFLNRVRFNCSDRREYDSIVYINASTIPLIAASPKFQLDNKHRLDFKITSENTSFIC